MSIEAMKQALEALEEVQRYDKTSEWFEKKVSALRQAIEQAEKQEPAFYVISATDRFGEGYEQTFWEDPAGFPVYTRPVYASDINQEPVDETAKCVHEFECPRCGHCCQQREWVGLTDEEIIKLWGSYFPRAMEFYQAIEAKLKEKNT